MKKLRGRCKKEIKVKYALFANDPMLVVNDASTGLAVYHDLFCSYQQRLR